MINSVSLLAVADKFPSPGLRAFFIIGEPLFGCITPLIPEALPRVEKICLAVEYVICGKYLVTERET